MGEERFNVSYLAIRRVVGVAGLLMPILVRVGAYLFEGISDLSTISAHYYTGMREVFVGTLVITGVMLACYRTPDPRDTWIGTIAGVAAIGIALFPMDPEFAKELHLLYPGLKSGDCYINRGFLGFHGIFVGLFFTLAFVLMYFRFGAHTAATPTPQKIVRNRIYKLCAIAMAGSGLSMLYFSTVKLNSGIFWSESAAVISFAIAWLVKGQYFVADRGRPKQASAA